MRCTRTNAGYQPIPGSSQSGTFHRSGPLDNEQLDIRLRSEATEPGNQVWPTSTRLCLFIGGDQYWLILCIWGAHSHVGLQKKSISWWHANAQSRLSRAQTTGWAVGVLPARLSSSFSTSWHIFPQMWTKSMPEYCLRAGSPGHSLFTSVWVWLGVLPAAPPIFNQTLEQYWVAECITSNNLRFLSLSKQSNSSSLVVVMDGKPFLAIETESDGAVNPPHQKSKRFLDLPLAQLQFPLVFRSETYLGLPWVIVCTCRGACETYWLTRLIDSSLEICKALGYSTSLVPTEAAQGTK